MFELKLKQHNKNHRASLSIKISTIWYLHEQSAVSNLVMCNLDLMYLNAVEHLYSIQTAILAESHPTAANRDRCDHIIFG